MPRDLHQELKSWDGEWPAAWKPQEGSILVGTVQQYSIAAGAYGPVRTMILEQENGERVSVWLSSTVLLSLFERDKPQVGERLGIRYLGKHPEKGYKRYTLIVDREATAPEFTPLGGEKADAGEYDPFA